MKSMLKHLQSLRNHGSVVRYYHDEIGYNYRMGGLRRSLIDC
jgi:dTDP-4-amino-4,6-dideoxygalactose transaminase